MQERLLFENDTKLKLTIYVKTLFLKKLVVGYTAAHITEIYTTFVSLWILNVKYMYYQYYQERIQRGFQGFWKLHFYLTHKYSHTLLPNARGLQVSFLQLQIDITSSSLKIMSLIFWYTSCGFRCLKKDLFALPVVIRACVDYSACYTRYVYSRRSTMATRLLF